MKYLLGILTGLNVNDVEVVIISNAYGSISCHIYIKIPRAKSAGRAQQKRIEEM